MKILITGGAGFIGSHISDFLLKREHEIVVIDNLITGKLENIQKNSEFYNKDITSGIEEIFEKEKPEIVIHTAAQVMLRESFKSPIYDAKTNIIGTINVLEGCRKNNVKKIIYTSTGGARYGEPEFLPITENHPIKPISPYGISKHTAEHYIEMYSKLHGLDYKTFCFGNVYGPRDDPSSNRVIPVFCRDIIKNQNPKIFGDGEQTRDFIYVLDLAEFIADSIEKTPINKVFNLANNSQISVNQIWNILKTISKSKLNPEYSGAIKGEVRDILLDTTLAEKELGWKPKHSIETGLNETFEWFKTNLN